MSIELTKEQILFIKNNLQLMLKAKSIDEVVGATRVLISYVDMVVPEDIELWLVNPSNVQNKIGVIKEIRSALGLGLKESKDLVEQTVAPIYKGSNVKLALDLQKAISPYAAIEVRGASAAMKVLF